LLKPSEIFNETVAVTSDAMASANSSKVMGRSLTVRHRHTRRVLHGGWASAPLFRAG
jgi:hypothetical protein